MYVYWLKCLLWRSICPTSVLVYELTKSLLEEPKSCPESLKRNPLYLGPVLLITSRVPLLICRLLCGGPFLTSQERYSRVPPCVRIDDLHEVWRHLIFILYVNINLLCILFLERRDCWTGWWRSKRQWSFTLTTEHYDTDNMRLGIFLNTCFL